MYLHGTGPIVARVFYYKLDHLLSPATMTQIRSEKYPDLSDVEKIMKEIMVRVMEALNRLGIEEKREISADIEDIWGELSILYYKYEDDAWKNAFREVLHYISEKIHDKRWPTVYMNLYRRARLAEALRSLPKLE